MGLLRIHKIIVHNFCFFVLYLSLTTACKVGHFFGKRVNIPKNISLNLNAIIKIESFK